MTIQQQPQTDPKTEQKTDPKTEPKTDPKAKQQVSTNNVSNVNIEPQTPGAADGTAEDALGEYKALLEQMKAQNAALIEQNKSLQAQFGILIRSGASVGRNGDSSSVSGSGNTDPVGSGQGTGQTGSQEPYVSLAELGSQIGKCDYGSHNSQKE
jgi:hypothetical protein